MLSAKPPPKMMQKAALPNAEAAICSHAGFGRMARMAFSRDSNCSRSHLPSETSRESWFTATTLSRLAPLMGMNLVRANPFAVAMMPLLSTKKFSSSTP